MLHATTTQVSAFLTTGYRKRADFEEAYSEGNLRDGALKRRAEKLVGVKIRFVDPMTQEEERAHT